MNKDRPDNTPESEERRAVLGKMASVTFAGLMLSGVLARAQDAAPQKTLIPAEPFRASSDAHQDVLIRMQGELERAMQRPINERRWGMVIDIRKCIGCSSCTVGCVMENKLPPGVVYRPVIDKEKGTYPNVERTFLPRPCMQCEDPACTPVCPVGATWKREDGIVVIDYDACIGCRYCLTACPYQARTFDFGEHWTDNAAQGADGALALTAARDYQNPPNFEYGKHWKRGEGIIPKSPVGNARKCTFCTHRLDQGMLPMCVSTCVGRATFFGDLNDPKSLVAELAEAPNASILKPEAGTHPNVYYLK
ncbi:MAG: 4Fe-4S dicluster domain-containing protein [Desulfobacteraceae bacterium]|nr:4Fe-4S dicluster domain-containing protein [Desulfobacteraceae bacterium]